MGRGGYLVVVGALIYGRGGFWMAKWVGVGGGGEGFGIVWYA